MWCLAKLGAFWATGVPGWYLLEGWERHLDGGIFPVVSQLSLSLVVEREIVGRASRSCSVGQEGWKGWWFWGHRSVLGLTGQVESFSQVSCPSLRQSLWLGERTQAQWGEQHPCQHLRSLPRASLLPLGQMLASRALLTPPLLSCPFQVHIRQQFTAIIGYRSYKYPPREEGSIFLPSWVPEQGNHKNTLCCLHWTLCALFALQYFENFCFSQWRENEELTSLPTASTRSELGGGLPDLLPHIQHHLPKHLPEFQEKTCTELSLGACKA